MEDDHLALRLLGSLSLPRSDQQSDYAWLFFRAYISSNQGCIGDLGDAYASYLAFLLLLG